ncbi:Aspartokinase [Coelomomyces lativittatus]|nr:Aspartokinase [Coelomomyces lativittatus]
MDVIVTTGEKLACIIVEAAFHVMNIPCHRLFLDHLFPPSTLPPTSDPMFYTTLATTLTSTFDPLPTPLIVPGYFGWFPDPLFATLGRGYSDYTASLIAVSLPNVTEWHVWKDVDGIYTTDPQQCPTAQVLSHVHVHEAVEWSQWGAQVLHPNTLRHPHVIPLRIRNILHPEAPGTWVTLDPLPPPSSSPSPSPASVPLLTSNVVGTPTGVTLKSNVLVISIFAMNPRNLGRHVFRVLADFDLHIELMCSTPSHVALAVQYDDASSMASEWKEKVVQALQPAGVVTLIQNQVILSVIGHQLAYSIGVASRMFRILANEHINIQMISQGPNEINISCVIAEVHGLRALRAVHDQMILGLEKK